LVTFLLRCNSDITSLLSGTAIKAIVAYISDYITKPGLKTHTIFEAIRSVFNRNSEMLDGSLKRKEKARKNLDSDYKLFNCKNGSSWSNGKSVFVGKSWRSGVSLWNPDIDSVSVDTVSPNDVRLSVDVLTLSSRLARRTSEFHLGVGLCDSFVDKPAQLSVHDPELSSELLEDHVVFAPQPPDVVVRETTAVLHMLTVTNLWLRTVDVDSLRSEDCLEMARLMGDSYQGVYERFPPASHEPGCSSVSLSTPPLEESVIGDCNASDVMPARPASLARKPRFKRKRATN
jgi:hypothetical protein